MQEFSNKHSWKHLFSTPAAEWKNECAITLSDTSRSSWDRI